MHMCMHSSFSFLRIWTQVLYNCWASLCERIMLSISKSNILFDFRIWIFFSILLLFCPWLLKAFPMTVHNLSSLAAVNSQRRMQKRRSHQAFLFLLWKEKHFLMAKPKVYSLNSRATVLLPSNVIAVGVETKECNPLFFLFFQMLHFWHLLHTYQLMM